MRKLAMFAVLVLAVGTVRAAADDQQATVKGPHLCCPQCEKSVKEILSKIDGVSDVKCDRPTKTVTFTAKDMAAANKALTALTEGGFFGELTVGKTAVPTPETKASTDKTDKVTIQNVHVCCGQCVNGLKAIFKDAKVTVNGKGAQREVVITGTDLTADGVLTRMHQGGFNGTVGDKK